MQLTCLFSATNNYFGTFFQNGTPPASLAICGASPSWGRLYKAHRKADAQEVNLEVPQMGFWL
jgi:hypothetical protein